MPVIAAVTGNALGGGLQIALGADIRIVAPDARLSVLEIKWGLIPDMTGSQLLPELVGRDVAKELTFTGRVVSGTEAVALGLATRTDPTRAAPRSSWPAPSPPAARTPSGRPSGCSTRPGRVDLTTGFAAEQKEIRALIGSPNQVEAVAAEFGKRPPSSPTRADRTADLYVRIVRRRFTPSGYEDKHSQPGRPTSPAHPTVGPRWSCSTG